MIHLSNISNLQKHGIAVNFSSIDDVLVSYFTEYSPGLSTMGPS